MARCLTELWFKILNCITWGKTNPPPNLSCRYFIYSAEYILWARREEKTPRYFNYELMKELNGGKQMHDVWRLPSIAPWEKNCGKHPTQKPLCLLSRIILASTKSSAWILSPFAELNTTGIAANLLQHRYLAIEQEENSLEMSVDRRKEIEQPNRRHECLNKPNNQAQIFHGKDVLVLADPKANYDPELPFCLGWLIMVYPLWLSIYFIFNIL